MSSIPQKKAVRLLPKRLSRSTRRGLSVDLAHHRYRIDVTSHDVGLLCKFLAKNCAKQNPLILTNAVVAPLYLADLQRGLRACGLKAPYLILPDGERHKTLKTVQKCYDWLLEQGADRQSVLVLLGGGVLGDIGGFVAATYLRGVPYVQVPTSLVAQVDSSIGGKVGVDHVAGKNLIGAFYQPQHVHIDIAYLEQLPEREYLCGLAEVIKYAVIRDREFFQFLSKDRVAILRREAGPLRKIVETCCCIKADVVMRDEKETRGLRMILNFGHTVGHALERLTEYRKFRHGEAVAMGMVAAASLSAVKDYCSAETAEAVCDMVAAYGLPVQWPKHTKRQWLQGLRHDKKMRGKDLNFVFVKKIGRVQVLEVDPSEVASHLTG